MAFNEEEVVRAIFESKIPIISAVGHEIDNSLSDYVADIRAPTPTAAAEIVLPDISVIKKNIDVFANTIFSTIQNTINFNKEKYKKYILPNFFKIIENKVQSLDIKNSELIYKKNSFLESVKNKISQNKIEFHSPLNYCRNQMLNLSSKAKLLGFVYKNLIDKKYYLFANKPESINEKYDKIITSMRLKYIKSSTALEAYNYTNILEKGFVLIEKIILMLWQKHIKKSVVTHIDAKTKLQEHALKNFKRLPVYKLISNSGPRHKPLFKVGVKLPNTKFFFSSGKSKKDAEQKAAIECLRYIK